MYRFECEWQNKSNIFALKRQVSIAEQLIQSLTMSTPQSVQVHTKITAIKYSTTKYLLTAHQSANRILTVLAVAIQQIYFSLGKSK